MKTNAQILDDAADLMERTPFYCPDNRGRGAICAAIAVEKACDDDDDYRVALNALISREGMVWVEQDPCVTVFRWNDAREKQDVIDALRRTARAERATN